MKTFCLKYSELHSGEPRELSEKFEEIWILSFIWIIWVQLICYLENIYLANKFFVRFIWLGQEFNKCYHESVLLHKYKTLQENIIFFHFFIYSHISNFRWAEDAISMSRYRYTLFSLGWNIQPPFHQ